MFRDKHYPYYSWYKGTTLINRKLYIKLKRAEMLCKKDLAINNLIGYSFETNITYLAIRSKQTIAY